MLKRIFKMIGIKIRKKSMKRWKQKTTQDFIIEADLEEISGKIKHMSIYCYSAFPLYLLWVFLYIIDHAQGYILRMAAINATDSQDKIDYLARAKKV